MPTRRNTLQGLAGGFIGSLTAVGLWPFRPRLAQAGTGLTFSYGWDPDVAAPTEASLYVAPDGDDTADGSLARPLRTLRRAVDLLATLPGGSLSIRGGIYREMITLDALQGQPDTPYLIHRHGQERVQITAAEVLTGWEPCPQDEAATLGLAPQGVFVTRFPKTLLMHGSLYALNLHEAGVWCSIAMDRADMRDPARNGDHDTYHNAEFVLDAEDRITAIRDPRLIGMPATQMQQVRALIYHSPNLISPGEIASFDPATGTITLADPGFVVQRKGDEYVMHYALQNLATALQDGQWIARETGADQIAVYLRPRDPATLEADIEVSLRPTCMDLGRAQHLTLLGLEALRAAGQDRLDGICIRRTIAADDTEQHLQILHCRIGENFSAAGRGYAALYLRGATGVTIHNTSIGPARNSFGLFLSDCRAADLRYLHITEVSISPARFFGLRQAVLAFSLFEDSAWDAHANKFNFYEGSDSVLVYGIRTRRVGGYATYQEASRIHFAFCELDCAPGSQNRALVSQNRNPGAEQGGADGSGDPAAATTFYYWNNSLLADPSMPEPANALRLGPNDSSQRHAFHNNILHGGGFAGVYLDGVDPAHEQRSHNRYTGLSHWQTPANGWHLGLSEEQMRVGGRPNQAGLDMRPALERDVMMQFPGFTDWGVDIDGAVVDWTAPPIGCKV